MPREASIFVETARSMQGSASVFDAALVAFSGGKDSLVVMDMARRAYKRVVGLYMYFVPGLRVIEERLKIAESWGVPVVQYPHWDFLLALKEGVYCPNHFKVRELPKLGLFDIYRLALKETGCDVLLTGMKASDSTARRQNLDKHLQNEYTFHPIKDWKDYDVLAYLQIHKIPKPPTPEGQRSTGIDLKAATLLWLHKNYPDDWQRLLEYFPYAETVLWREKWYPQGGVA